MSSVSYSYENIIGSLSIFIIFFIVFLIILFKLWTASSASSATGSGPGSGSGIEGFSATGLVYNQFPNWFLKKPYDPADWLVTVYPDHIQASCLPYSVESKYGSLEDINYNSQAYRFWRF